MEIARSPYIKHLTVCVNRRENGEVCCAQGDSEAIRERLKAYVKEHGLKGKVRVSQSGCMDLCAKGPNVMVYPEGRWYRQVRIEDVDDIIQAELVPLLDKAPSPSRGEGKPVCRTGGGEGEMSTAR